MLNKVVIVTGASSGIGLSLAHEFASKGASVVLAARSQNRLENIVAELLARYSGKYLAVTTDVTNEQQCKNLIDTTISHFGRLDVLINNAGLSMRALFEETDLQVLRSLMDTNFWGTVYCSKFALPHLLRSRGSLVGVISVTGFIGLPARSGYSASKFAIRGLLDTIRVENLRKGLHVLVIAPGFTTSNIRRSALTADGTAQGETPRDEQGMMSSDAVAHKIYLGVVRRRRQIILTFFQGKVSVALKTIWPSLLDRLTYRAMAKEPHSPLN